MPIDNQLSGTRSHVRYEVRLGLFELIIGGVLYEDRYARPEQDTGSRTRPVQIGGWHFYDVAG
ncbi:hypothetical protein DEJ30_09075 [Curtobacterium sp. MCPF17_003]|nr:hypothetical protein DEJ30_09075 [Curtobacterium sp. MCPF17_003]